MFETPEASPTCFSSTQDVAADDDGPFESPMPTAMAMMGSRNAAYCQDAWVKPIAAKPAVLIRNPAPMVWRPPSFLANRGTSGATTTRPTVAGRVARPASSGLNPSDAGSWKYRLSRYISPLMVPAPIRMASVD